MLATQVYEDLQQYERSLDRFGILDLGRINYAGIDFGNYPLIAKIIRSLLYEALIFETSIPDRMRTWIITLNEDKVYTAGCLSSEPLFSLQVIKKKPEGATFWREIISKSIMDNSDDSDGVMSGLAMYYATLPYAAEKTEYLKYLLLRSDDSPDYTHTILRQVIPEDTVTLRELLLNANDNYTTILSAFLQISLTLMSLFTVSGKKLYTIGLNVGDITVSKSKRTEISYGPFGILTLYGYQATLDAYEKFRGSISIGNKSYPLPSANPEKDIFDTLSGIGSLVESIVTSINNPHTLTGKMHDLYTIFKNIWSRMQTTEILDSLVVFHDEFHSFDDFYSNWRPGKTALLLPLGERNVISSVPHITAAQVTIWGPWAHIRAAYDESHDELMHHQSRVVLEQLQQRYYRHLLEAARLLRVKKANKKVSRDTVDSQKAIFMAIEYLYMLASVSKVMNYLFPEEAASTAIRTCIKNNWKTLQKYIKKSARSAIEPVLLDYQ